MLLNRFTLLLPLRGCIAIRHVCLCVYSFVSLFMCSLTFVGAVYLENGWRVRHSSKWTTNRKWHMVNQMVTVTPICWGLISRKRLEIATQLQWSTYRKLHVGNRMVMCSMTSRPVVGGRRCVGLAGVAVSDCLSSYCCLFCFVAGRTPITCRHRALTTCLCSREWHLLFTGINCCHVALPVRGCRMNST